MNQSNGKVVSVANPSDPTLNVRELINDAVQRVDDLRKTELRRIDDKIDASDVRYQIQFNSAKEAISIALIAQEKAVAAALDGTRESINKADITTDKRFDLLSEKIDGVMNVLNKNSGERVIYVTHADLANEMEKLRTSFESMLRPVVTFMNSQTGKGVGANQLWGYIIGAIGLLATVLAIANRF